MVLPFDDRRATTLAGGLYTVHSTRHEVQFRGCGTAVGLHPVSVDGHVHLFLRALPDDSGGWLVLDLRDLVPELAVDFVRHEGRDHPGLVFFSLRQCWPTRRSWMASAQANARWRGPADAEQLQEAA